MAAPILAAVKSAASKALSTKLKNSGLAKRVAKIQGLADVVSDIASAVKELKSSSAAPNMTDEVSQNQNVDWSNLPDFNGWNVNQIDSYLFGGNSREEGGRDE